MGLRIRKSIKIAPGLKINLSKSGASLSVGGKGLTTNIGKKGVRTTVGVPGTGISYSSHTPYGGGRQAGAQPNSAPTARSAPSTAGGLILLAILAVILVALFAR